MNLHEIDWVSDSYPNHNISGLLCFAIGVVIIVADVLLYDKLVAFFGLDILSDYEEIYGGKFSKRKQTC